MIFFSLRSESNQNFSILACRVGEGGCVHIFGSFLSVSQANDAFHHICTLTFIPEIPQSNPGLGKNFGKFQTPPLGRFTRHKNKLLTCKFFLVVKPIYAPNILQLLQTLIQTSTCAFSSLLSGAGNGPSRRHI